MQEPRSGCFGVLKNFNGQKVNYSLGYQQLQYHASNSQLTVEPDASTTLALVPTPTRWPLMMIEVAADVKGAVKLP
jgi:hypothetical protein